MFSFDVRANLTEWGELDSFLSNSKLPSSFWITYRVQADCDDESVWPLNPRTPAHIPPGWQQQWAGVLQNMQAQRALVGFQMLTKLQSDLFLRIHWWVMAFRNQDEPVTINNSHSACSCFHDASLSNIRSGLIRRLVIHFSVHLNMF